MPGGRGCANLPPVRSRKGQGVAAPGAGSGHAVVAGAGNAGLAAAAARSPLFDTITILEKDRLPADPRPREGVAQGQYVHVLLIGGLAPIRRASSRGRGCPYV